LCGGLGETTPQVREIERIWGAFDFDFNIPTALKGWVGHAPQGRGALLIIIFI